MTGAAKKKSRKSENDARYSWWERLIYGKGTIAEPWATAEEVLARKEIKEGIKNIEEVFNKYKNRENGK